MCLGITGLGRIDCRAIQSTEVDVCECQHTAFVLVYGAAGTLVVVTVGERNRMDFRADNGKGHARLIPAANGTATITCISIAVLERSLSTFHVLYPKVLLIVNGTAF